MDVAVGVGVDGNVALNPRDYSFEVLSCDDPRSVRRRSEIAAEAASPGRSSESTKGAKSSDKAKTGRGDRVN